MTRTRTLALWFAAALVVSCGTAPQVSQDLMPRHDTLLAAMRVAAMQPVPKPPPIFLSQGWPNYRFGTVVAVDGPMVAIRLEQHDHDGFTWDPERFAVAHITGAARGSDIKGHCVLVAHLDDLVVCRYFDSSTKLNPDPPYLGDPTAFNGDDTAKLAEDMAKGTAEWVPASATRQ